MPETTTAGTLPPEVLAYLQQFETSRAAPYVNMWNRNMGTSIWGTNPTNPQWPVPGQPGTGPIIALSFPEWLNRYGAAGLTIPENATNFEYYPDGQLYSFTVDGVRYQDTTRTAGYGVDEPSRFEDFTGDLMHEDLVDVFTLGGETTRHSEQVLADIDPLISEGARDFVGHTVTGLVGGAAGTPISIATTDYDIAGGGQAGAENVISGGTQHGINTLLYLGGAELAQGLGGAPVAGAEAGGITTYPIAGTAADVAGAVGTPTVIGAGGVTLGDVAAAGSAAGALEGAAGGGGTAPAPAPAPTGGYNPQTGLGRFIDDPAGAIGAFLTETGATWDQFLSNPDAFIADLVARYGQDVLDFFGGAGGAGGAGGSNGAALAALLLGGLAGGALGGNDPQTTTHRQVQTQQPSTLLTGTDPMSVATQEALMRQLGAADLQNNPYFQQYLEAALRPTRQYFNEQVLPGIAGEAITTGGYGGSRQGVAQGLAAGRLAQAEGDTTAKIMESFYLHGLQAERAGIGLAEGLQGRTTVTENTIEAEINPILGAITGLSTGLGIIGQLSQVGLIGPNGVLGTASGPFAMGLLGLLGALGANP